MVANRRSLINLEETVQNDEEWDAILGELSVLESQVRRDHFYLFTFTMMK